jgi:aryl-alcohol dehydrogenase-like predicted oxidoreductase
VQFHWWDYEVPRYLEAAHYLRDLQKKGKIRHIGVTNFSPERLREIVDSGVPVVSAQVQYSLLDRRSEKSLTAYCAFKDIKLLCYGSLAGGFLSERYLNIPEPSEPLENRSLAKYKLIIDEFGDWTTFQNLLRVLDRIANRHQVKIANVAMRYVLDKLAVASVIVGARNDNHLTSVLRTFDFSLDREDYEAIQSVLSKAHSIPGEVYELERNKKGKHGSIMRYNLNQHDT